MISILTTILGVVAKGRASKAIAGGLAGALINGAGPLIDAFSQGVFTGAEPAVAQLGVAVGQFVIGGAVGWVLTWLAPANEPKP